MPRYEYRIETRFGYYAEAVRIAWARFAASDRASFQGATVYATATCARRAIAKFGLKNANVNETPA